MRHYKRFLGFSAYAVLLALGLLSCSTDAPTEEPLQGRLTEGSARKVFSAGVVFRLGSTDPLSAKEEQPGYARFDYDYWIDTTEVTQAEFFGLLGRNPSSIKGEAMPVTEVSWFDAIAAANARSKRDGLDTVYEYRAITTDSVKNIVNITGLVVYLNRSGWRLPSEAEWEFAARANTKSPFPWGEISDSAQASQYAWYQKNSSGGYSDVAKLKPNEWGIYDMAGNVMEFVGDWKGGFPKDTVLNFSGLEAPSEVFDIPLKGGAFNFGIANLRPSSRSAIYIPSRSTRVQYVGFRLARGGFSASYLTPSGEASRIPVVSILNDNVAAMLGVRSARLVFLNRSNGTGMLSWIDFGQNTPMVRSLPDSFPVFHPVISPDGKWVAWGTGLEGSTGASRIRARRLIQGDSTVLDLGSGAIPRWWTAGSDTFLIWSSSTMDNISSDWEQSRTYAQRWSAGGLRGVVEDWAPGAFHDGRSGRYLYTGYRRLKQYDIDQRKSRTLFTFPQNGKSAGDTSQVCNVSASPDATGRAIFLDFGYSGKSSVVGRPYGIHEIAFMVDSLGRVIGNIESPEGESQWDHLEWSNSSRWAVSGSRNRSGDYRNIYLMDLESGTSSKLISGEELWQPALWMSEPIRRVPGAIDLDSAGKYSAKIRYDIKYPIGDAVLREFSGKLSLYWLVRDSVEIAIVGNSRVAGGVIRSEFKSGNTFNWGISGTITVADVNLIRSYVMNSPKLKVVGLAITPAWFLEWGDDAGWLSETNSVGFRYDQNHNFWKDSLPPGFREAVKLNALSDSVGLQKSSGEWYLESDGWGSTSPRLYPDDGAEAERSYFASNMKLVRDLTSDLRAKGITLVLIVFPESPHYRNTAYAGMYGPKWPTYHELIDSVKSLSTQYWNFKFYDAYQSGNHDYDSLDFNNESHLSYRGGVKFSRRLDSLIGSWKAID